MRGTLDYVIRDLQSEAGGIYSTEDADSEGVEGKYYVWSHREVVELLGDDADLFCQYFDVTPQGNWEGTNILHVPRELDVVAQVAGKSEDALVAALTRGMKTLFEARQNRVRPGLDDKVLSGWNGLMISALAQAGAVLDEPTYVEAAAKAARFVLDEMTKDGDLLRSYRDDSAKIAGFLEDYARVG